MPGITLEIAQAQLQRWLDADTGVAKSQSYSIDDRTLTRANAAEITNKIEYWSLKVQLLSARASGRGRSVVITNA
jgi:hypothetical protein